LTALQADRDPDAKARRHPTVSFKPTVSYLEPSSQGPVLRNALGHLARQRQLIEDSLEQDEQADTGVSPETQALLAGYQAQGADVQQQVQQYAGTFSSSFLWTRIRFLPKPGAIWSECIE
jgi:hypothetical protein